MIRKLAIPLASAAAILACLIAMFGQRQHSVSAQSAPRPFHVSGTALPGFALTAPIPIEGTALDSGSSYIVDQIVLSNSDTAAHNVEISDCGTPPFILSFIGIAPPATSNVNPILISMPGTIFNGCVQWMSDSPLVLGTLAGSR